MLSKRHFKVVANIIGVLSDDYIKNMSPLKVKRLIAEELALYFAEENEHFDEQRFFDACGIEAPLTSNRCPKGE